MTFKHNRKKQPELVRASLIGNALKLAEKGTLSAISVQAVCDLAGVTKGAFFHHFKNKDDLLKCVYERMISDISAEIDSLIAADPHEKGAFIRAYFEQGISTLKDAGLMTLWKSAMDDEHICARWREWYLGILRQRGRLEDSPALAIIRMAADGLCLGASIHTLPEDLEAVISALRQQASAE